MPFFLDASNPILIAMTLNTLKKNQYFFVIYIAVATSIQFNQSLNVPDAFRVYCYCPMRQIRINIDLGT
jgi:hypothetical protein